MRSVIALLSICFCEIGRAQIHNSTWSPIAFSSGHNIASVSVLHPASLASRKLFALSIQSERRYMLPDLGIHVLGIVLPTKTGTFGATHSMLHHTNYKSSGSTISYGMQMNDRISTGVSFSFEMTNTVGYSKSSGISAGIGTALKLNTQLQLGVQLINIRKKMAVPDGVNPMSYQVGVGYDLSPEVFIGAKFSMNAIHSSAEVLLLYAPHEKFVFIVSMRSDPFLPRMGAMLLVRKMRVCVFTSLHTQLGLSPGMLITYQRTTE